MEVKEKSSKTNLFDRSMASFKTAAAPSLKGGAYITADALARQDQKLAKLLDELPKGIKLEPETIPEIMAREKNLRDYNVAVAKGVENRSALLSKLMGKTALDIAKSQPNPNPAIVSMLSTPKKLGR